MAWALDLRDPGFQKRKNGPLRIVRSASTAQSEEIGARTHAAAVAEEGDPTSAPRMLFWKSYNGRIRGNSPMVSHGIPLGVL